MAQRIKTVQESDLRMLGDLARSIQRVLPVTQADIDAAAALGKGWVVWKVFEVSDPLDNLRGGTQLVIRQNSIQPGQSVQRVLIVSGPGGQTVVIRGSDYIVLPDAIANSLSYVKAFGGTEQRNLPDNYIERQFIYMMDGSYIKVEDLPISAGYRVEFDFQTLTLPSSLCNYIGGRATGVSAGGGFRLAKLAVNSSYNNNVVLYGFESGTEYYAPEQFQANTRYKYTYNNGVCTLESGGSVISTKTFTVTDNTSTDWGINAYNGTTWQTASSGIYVYSLKVWNDQGELVMDLVPAVQRGTVPVVGFYDTVSGTFKTATAGTFAAGGEAVPTPDAPMDIVSNNGVLKARHQSGLPLGYTLLEYIESTGTQYIDTGIVGESNWEVSAQGTQTYSGTQILIGGSNSSGRWLGTRSADDCWGITGVSSGIPYSTKIVAEINFTDSTNTTVINGNTITTSTTGTLGNYLLFNQYNQGALSYPFYGKVFYAKAYQNNTLVRDLVPCKNASNVVGLYDRVNGVFYTDTGLVAGTAVSDPVEIYTDGTVETINVHGKNLFDVTDDSPNKFWSVEGQETESMAGGVYFVHSGFIPCQPNTSYTISGKRIADGISYVYSCAFFDKNKQFIERQSGSPSVVQNENYVKTFVSPVNASYMSFNHFANDENVQIEKGSTATEYQPYYDGGTATAEMLLKVGDYQDVQSIIDGVVTRNVGVKVLDGTETGFEYSASRFSFLLDDTFALPNTCICTHYIGVSSDTTVAQMTDMQIKCGYTGFQNKVYLKDSRFTSAATMQQWLAAQYAAGTPVIVIYLLATPTTESVAGQTLQVTDGDNVLEITQASLNGLELEAEYQAAVSLTIQEVQDANLDPNVEVTIS